MSTMTLDDINRENCIKKEYQFQVLDTYHIQAECPHCGALSQSLDIRTLGRTGQRCSCGSLFFKRFCYSLQSTTDHKIPHHDWHQIVVDLVTIFDNNNALATHLSNEYNLNINREHIRYIILHDKDVCPRWEFGQALLLAHAEFKTRIEKRKQFLSTAVDPTFVDFSVDSYEDEDVELADTFKAR